MNNWRSKEHEVAQTILEQDLFGLLERCNGGEVHFNRKAIELLFVRRVDSVYVIDLREPNWPTIDEFEIKKWGHSVGEAIDAYINCVVKAEAKL